MSFVTDVFYLFLPQHTMPVHNTQGVLAGVGNDFWTPNTVCQCGGSTRWCVWNNPTVEISGPYLQHNVTGPYPSIFRYFARVGNGPAVAIAPPYLPHIMPLRPETIRHLQREHQRELIACGVMSTPPASPTKERKQNRRSTTSPPVGAGKSRKMNYVLSTTVQAAFCKKRALEP